MSNLHKLLVIHVSREKLRDDDDDVEAGDENGRRARTIGSSSAANRHSDDAPSFPKIVTTRSIHETKSELVCYLKEEQ